MNYAKYRLLAIGVLYWLSGNADEAAKAHQRDINVSQQETGKETTPLIGILFDPNSLSYLMPIVNHCV